MRRIFSFALLVPLLLHPSPARAGSDAVDQAKQRFAAGAQAYREHRYKDAIDFFLQANGLDPHPELVFNVGTRALLSQHFTLLASLGTDVDNTSGPRNRVVSYLGLQLNL